MGINSGFEGLIEIFIKDMSAMEVMCYKIIGVVVLNCTPRVQVKLEQA